MTQVADPYPHTAPPRNGFGITALVLALIGLVFGFLPLTGFLALILGALAVLFGLLGVARTRKGLATNKIMSWVGTALGGLSLVIGIWGVVIVYQVTEQLVRDLDEISTGLQTPPAPGQGNTPADVVPAAPEAEAGPSVVRYEVDGTGTALTINYSTANGGGFSSESVTDARLPWSVEVPVNPEGFTSYDLMASNDENGGTITCRILVNGQVVQEATSKGPYQMVMCMR
ncbi:membrane protein [Saccharopolyspora antimicrobica]|uniref:Membrane protein n=1 Tax=Saccharopolyspora antimicrobica TaxID=455193 RepID=A0A1I5GNQ8_9PSEU|nr:MmpS family transport accessory protein [Saccharopolyspora antimicrobica]RKT87439.1 MmpS family membrane protein [Saccharopolyspora antimicrobica]SFO37540.1 membrane protein [Saccharopolyspora antimicrobica]